MAAVGWLSHNNPFYTEEAWRNFSTHHHKHYCSIDLHARAMDVCILDQYGTERGHKNLPPPPQAFLRVIAPSKADLGGGGCPPPTAIGGGRAQRSDWSRGLCPRPCGSANNGNESCAGTAGELQMSPPRTGNCSEQWSHSYALSLCAQRFRLNLTGFFHV